MTTEQWILNLGLLVFILGSNLGTRTVSRRRLALPLVLAALAGVLLLPGTPALGNDTALAAIGAGAGIALGVVAGIFMAVERRSDGSIVSRAGAAYALLWILVIGGRIGFAESATGWASGAVRDFSISNHISGGAAWTAAFVVMALAMVGSRVLTTALRWRSLQARTRPAATGGVGIRKEPVITTPPVRSHQRPFATALLLAAATAAATICTALLLGALAPDLEPMQQRFIAVVALAVAATGYVAARNREIFTSGRVRWALLAVPAVVALTPFAGGLKDPGLTATVMIVGGYLATGVYEELWFRGVVLAALAPWAPLRAAGVSSALFGLAHLSNIAFGANPAVTAAQVVGASCFGFGLAALRLRGSGIWPLVLIHAVSDIALQLGDVSTAWRWGIMIGGDVILLVFGLVLLRRGPAGGEAGGIGGRAAGVQRREASAV